MDASDTEPTAGPSGHPIAGDATTGRPDRQVPSRPLVSVLIPAYQAEATLGGTISSILTQTYEPVEIIVVDDGSTDATPHIAQAYGDHIRFESVPNGGTARARNRAFAQATGEFVALCDADDLFTPSYLEAAMEAWEQAGGGRRFVTCNGFLLTSGGIGHGRTVMADRVPPPSRQRRAGSPDRDGSGDARSGRRRKATRNPPDRA